MDQGTKEALEHAAKALENVTDIFHKIAGPVAEEVGLMLGDRAREYRLKNLVKILGRMKAIIAASGVEPAIIPPRLSLPALQAASVEDDDALQEKWAALLSNAALPNSDAQVLPSFVEILKELSPFDAQFLDRAYDETQDPGPTPSLAPSGALRRDTLQSVPDIVIANLERLGLLTRDTNIKYLDVAPGTNVMPRSNYLFLSVLGAAFVRACRPQEHD